MKKILISALVIISGCDLPKTKEGCTQYLSEAMQASTAACIAAYNEEIARAKGGVVTKCTRVGADLSCTTY